MTGGVFSSAENGIPLLHQLFISFMTVKQQELEMHCWNMDFTLPKAVIFRINSGKFDFNMRQHVLSITAVNFGKTSMLSALPFFKKCIHIKQFSGKQSDCPLAVKGVY